MNKKWKPSKRQRREFAEKMQDSEFARAYLERKEKRAEHRRATSAYDYETAGGYYVPTELQYKAALTLGAMTKDLKVKEACNWVLYGYDSKERVHHDYIHVVNEFIRTYKFY